MIGSRNVDVQTRVYTNREFLGIGEFYSVPLDGMVGRMRGKPEQVLVDMQNPRAEGRHVSLYTVTLDNVPPLFPQCPSPSLLDLPSCHLLVTNIHCVDVTAGTFQICESRFTL